MICHKRKSAVKEGLMALDSVAQDIVIIKSLSDTQRDIESLRCYQTLISEDFPVSLNDRLKLGTVTTQFAVLKLVNIKLQNDEWCLSFRFLFSVS